MNRVFSFVFCACALASALTLNPFVDQMSNFVDDSLVATYKLGTADTTEIFGLSARHQIGPDMALHSTLFYKVRPDSIDTTNTNCQIIIQEVDYSALIGDTVYTIIADTTIDTLTTTGAAGDTLWTKKAFAANPANGYRAIVTGVSGCSSVMNSKLLLWFHLRKKIGTYR